MFGEFIGNDLNEWAKHFNLSEKLLSFLREDFECFTVADLQFIYNDKSLLKQVEEAVSKIDYHKFLMAKRLTAGLNGPVSVPAASFIAPPAPPVVTPESFSAPMLPSPAPSVSSLVPLSATKPPSAPVYPAYPVTSTPLMGSLSSVVSVPLPGSARTASIGSSSSSYLFPGTPSALDRELAEKQRQLDELNAKVERQKRKEEELRHLDLQLLEAKEKKRRIRDRNKVIQSRSRKIRELENEICRAASLDVVIVLDCTASMTPYIDQAKQKIKAFVADIIALHPNVSLRLGFVGYRDHSNAEKRLEVLRFTTNVEEFNRRIDEVRPIANDDDAEDVLGGLHVAKAFEWMSQTRILYHIGDSPCHGREYHTSKIGDNHLNGCPNGLKVEDVLKGIYDLNLLYYFGQIKKDNTEIMISKFNQFFKSYQESLGKPLDMINKPYIMITDMNAGNMMEIITQSVSIAFSETLSSSSRTPDESKAAKKDVILDKNPPNFSLVAEEGALQYLMTMPESLPAFFEQLDENEEDKCIKDFPEDTRLILKVAPLPFAQGSMRAAYHALMITPATATRPRQETPMILKESLYVNAAHLTKQKYEHYLSCHRIAKYLADLFNMMKPKTTSTITFTDASILHFMARRGQPYFILESAIPETFEKYNNNNGYCARNPTPTGVNHNAIQAFSHWSYCFSNEQLIVVDCQGGYCASKDLFTLSDPAVHYVDVSHFGGTNLGMEGIRRFFSNHVCNPICAAMGLRPVAIPAAATPMTPLASMTTPLTPLKAL